MNKTELFVTLLMVLIFIWVSSIFLSQDVGIIYPEYSYDVGDMLWNILPILIGVLLVGSVYWGLVRESKSNLKLEYLTPDEVDEIKKYRVFKKGVK